MDRRWLWIAIWWSGMISLASFFASCAAARPMVVPESNSDSTVTVYLVGHGYHVGLFLPARSIPDSLIPERNDFPSAQYLEFGWGDADFYQAPGFNLYYGLKALFWPTGSVLHVVGYRREIPQVYLTSPVVALSLRERQFIRLARFVHQTFRRDGKPRAQPLGPGIYGNSRFYPAHGTYSFLKTCNTWTAQALRQAGCPLRPRWILTAGALMKAAARCSQHMAPQQPAEKEDPSEKE